MQECQLYPVKFVGAKMEAKITTIQSETFSGEVWCPFSLVFELAKQRLSLDMLLPQLCVQISELSVQGDA